MSNGELGFKDESQSSYGGERGCGGAATASTQCTGPTTLDASSYRRVKLPLLAACALLATKTLLRCSHRCHACTSQLCTIQPPSCPSLNTLLSP